MGFIDFTNGEVLTADQMDLVMRQGIMRFADAAARDTALSAVLAEGMMAYLDDTDEVLKYDGTDWIDISGDITGVTAGTALTGGGTSGNVTLDVDESALTIAQSQVTDLVSDLADKQDDIITTQGDLIVGDASGDPVRLPVGSADTVLTSNGTTATWVEGASGGGFFFGNLPADTVSIFDVDFPANSLVRFSAITTFTDAFNISLYDSSNVLVDTISVDRDNPFSYFTNATAVAKVGVNNDFVDETAILVFSQPTAATDAATAAEIITITSTQSVTISSTFDAYIFGGGGSGGAAGSTSNWASGGGSGFFATTTLSSGTYTATIGAGAEIAPSYDANGLTGGTSEINGVSAAGGSGGAYLGNGGAGGSGGGSGGGSFGAGGKNGGDGGDASASGGSGSGVSLPTSIIESFVLVPGNEANDKAQSGGLYEGGAGSATGSSTSASGAGLTGGSAGVSSGFRAAGGNGLIILIGA